MTSRRVPFGFPVRLPRPRSEVTRFLPGAAGWSSAPDILAGASSIVSGQNVWRDKGRLRPRERLTQVGTDLPSTDVINGFFTHHDISGDDYALTTSKDTVAYLNVDSWTSLTYVSNNSDHDLSGSENDLFFGDSVYLPRRDLNITVFTNGADPVYAWGGPSDGTAFSTLTQGPICRDLAIFDDRVVAWNTRELSGSTRFLTRVQWSVAGDPEDWTGIGSGFRDLVHMRGEGTKIFALEDEMLLASNKELWRGRLTVQPLTFDFNPIEKELGIPFAHAALNTPGGIFWLNDDFRVYRFAAGAVQEVGQEIHRELRDTLADFDKAFLSWHDDREQLTLHYSATVGSHPQRAFTLNVSDGRWTPQRFSHNLTAAGVITVQSSSTTWGGLTGTIGSQTLTYEQLLGDDGTDQVAFGTSNGTVYTYSSTNSLDDTQVVTAQVFTGALLHQDPTRIKFLDELRLSLQADSASSLSVAISGNLGGAFQNTNEIAVSANSNSTQHLLRPKVSGTYHTMRVMSDDTGWYLGDVFARAKVLGESS